MDKTYLKDCKKENPIRISMQLTPHERVVMFRKEAKKVNKYIYFKFTKDGADLMQCPVWFKNLAEKYLILDKNLFKMEYKPNPKQIDSLSIMEDIGLVLRKRGSHGKH